MKKIGSKGNDYNWWREEGENLKRNYFAQRGQSLPPVG